VRFQKYSCVCVPGIKIYLAKNAVPGEGDCQRWKNEVNSFLRVFDRAGFAKALAFFYNKSLNCQICESILLIAAS
jgi:hypothetical protein